MNIEDYGIMSGRIISEDRDGRGNYIVYNLTDLVRGIVKPVGSVERIEDYGIGTGRIIGEETDNEGGNVIYNIADLARENKPDLSGYLPLTGGTIDGDLNVNELGADRIVADSISGEHIYEGNEALPDKYVTKSYGDSRYAPAGFGLGGSCTRFPMGADLNDIRSTGFYVVYGDSVNTPANDNGADSAAYKYGTAEWWYIINIEWSQNWIKQLAFPLHNNKSGIVGNIYSRTLTETAGGTQWSKWELVNDGEFIRNKGVLAGTTESPVDADELVKSGEYYIQNGTNLPDGFKHGYLKVEEGYNSDYILQTFIECHSENKGIYVRKMVSGSWKEWERIFDGNLKVDENNYKDIFSKSLSNSHPCFNKFCYVNGKVSEIENCPKSSSFANWGNDTLVWFEVLTIGKPSGGQRTFQVAWGCFTPQQNDCHIRYCHDGNWTDWQEIITDNNFGRYLSKSGELQNTMRITETDGGSLNDCLSDGFYICSNMSNVPDNRAFGSLIVTSSLNEDDDGYNRNWKRQVWLSEGDYGIYTRYKSSSSAWSEWKAALGGTSFAQPGKFSEKSLNDYEKQGIYYGEYVKDYPSGGGYHGVLTVFEIPAAEAGTVIRQVWIDSGYGIYTRYKNGGGNWAAWKGLAL